MAPRSQKWSIRRFWLYDKVFTLVLARERLSPVRQSCLQYLGTRKGLVCNPTKMERVFGGHWAEQSQSLLGCGLLSIQGIQYRMCETEGQVAVNLGTCHHFYILTLM